MPPNLHFVEPNPELKLETTPFALPLTLTPLLETGHGRFAGVSSFGYGGTNSHVILEAPPPAPSVEPPARIHHVLTLSARNDEALRELAGRYRDRLEGVDAPTLAALCHAANTRRSRLGHRLALAVGDAGDMAAGLTAYVAGEPWARLRTGSGNAAPAIAFMFTGQGTRIGPGIRFLYDRYAVFRTVIERCSQILAGELDQPLAEILFSADPTRLQPTAVAQPVLFAVEAALADLWQSFGVVPTAVLGHSLGEYVAAYVAGVFSLEDGLRLVTARGKMMQALPPGGQMIAVFEEPEVVKRAIAGREDRLSIAAINGDRHTVLSGDRTAVEAVLAELGEDTLTSEPFTVSHAFHSPLMAPMCEGFAAIAREVSYQAPRLPMGSNELGDFLPADALPDADHWVRHVREPVRFVGNVLAASQLPVGLFLEVGPDAILTGMARRLLPKESLCVPSLKVDAEEATFAEAMATLSAAGIPLDGHAIDGEAAWPHTKLPRYPFQRHRCWLSPEEIRTFATEGSTP